MKKEECFSLGYIARKIGNHGELGFVLDVDDPLRYANLESVFVERQNSLVPFFIKKISIKGKNATVAIEGIDTIAQAQELVKSSLYLPLSMLPPLSGKRFYFHELPGYTASDINHGELGTVKGVLDFPQQAILQIMKDDKEILIPARDEFIEKIDRQTKHITLSAPSGLIDLYLGSGEIDNSEIETDTE